LLAVCSVPFCIRGLGGTGVPRSSVPFWCNDWVALEYGSVGVSTPRDLPGEEIRMAFFPAGGLGRSRGVGRGGCHSGMELFAASLTGIRRLPWIIFVSCGLVTRLVSSEGSGIVWEMGCLLSCWCVGAAVGDAHSLCVRSYGCLDSQVDFCWGSRLPGSSGVRLRNVFRGDGIRVGSAHLVAVVCGLVRSWFRFRS